LVSLTCPRHSHASRRTPTPATLLAATLVALLTTVQDAPVRDSVTLEQALGRARAARPRVAAASGAAERGRGAGRVATIIPNPQAQLETDHSAPTRKLTVVQPLGWIVRRPWDLSVGRALRDRGVADSLIVLADLGRDVRAAFFTSLANDEQYRLLREQASLADSLVLTANRRLEAGDLSELERDQFAQEASRARLAYWEAREQASVARLDLARAIAVPVTAPPRPVGALDEGLDDATLDGSDGDVASLPAMRGAVADSIAARNRLRSAQWAMLPIPSLLAGREWGGDVELRREAIVGLSVPIPIWSQGREAVAEARGLAAEQAARTAEARLTLGSELLAAQTRLRESALRARFARDSLMTEARRVRAGAVRLYEAGRTGVLPVFEALRAERDVARAMVRELLAFQEARADLAALRGLP
jgi:cobalt-zinc-cadmium efflux system outer membrane protein